MSRQGRLTARPGVAGRPGQEGLQPLPLGGTRDSYLYVPESCRPDRPAPLAVMLHGAGGHAHHGLALLQSLSEAAGLLLVAPASESQTWDVIMGGYGPDAERIDEALAHVFDRYSVDPERLAIGGFSDGASYALSLGITNGDLFTHVLAFSPGFVAPAAERDTPKVFVSHGTEDAVLPVDRCSRRLVPALRNAGYPVEYHEFKGPHTVPADVARAAVEWFLDRELGA